MNMANNGFFRPPDILPTLFPPPPFPPPSGDLNHRYLGPPFLQWRPRGPTHPAPRFTGEPTGHHFPPPPPWFLPPSAPPHCGQFPVVERPFTNFQIPPPLLQLKTVESQREMDKKWIENFVTRNCKCARDEIPGKQKLSRQDKSIKISEAKRLHRQAYALIKQLTETENSTESEHTSGLKEELHKILSFLNDEKVIANLAIAVKKRIKKRKRLKLKRHEMFLERKEEEIRIQQKHEVIDEWLQRRLEEEQNQKREKQVQKDLDNYLKEVRQKQTDFKKSLELVNALAKLRKARKESAIRKGTAPSQDHDEIFSNVHSSACDHLLSNISSCEEEEKKLRSFRAEEHRMEEEKIKRTKLEKENARRAKWLHDQERALFGPPGCLDMSDPMWPTQELHKQASRNLIALAHTRQQWDQYVTDTGTRIPTCWVEPVAPSGEDWKGYLDENLASQ